MTTPRTLTPETVPDIPPPAGHALLTERHGEEITAHCECGVLFGQGPATTDTALAWAQHMAEVG